MDRSPGDRWMIRGPLEYVPPVEVEVVTKRKAIPLDENEGIYVRDIKTGKVRRGMEGGGLLKELVRVEQFFLIRSVPYVEQHTC